MTPLDRRRVAVAKENRLGGDMTARGGGKGRLIAGLTIDPFPYPDLRRVSLRNSFSLEDAQSLLRFSNLSESPPLLARSPSMPPADDNTPSSERRSPRSEQTKTPSSFPPSSPPLPSPPVPVSVPSGVTHERSRSAQSASLGNAMTDLPTG
jgi:hypothetical protein